MIEHGDAEVIRIIYVAGAGRFHFRRLGLLSRSRAPVYRMHDEEVGLIEGEESGSLLIRQCTSGRSLRSTFLSLRFVPRLDGMRVDDCPN